MTPPPESTPPATVAPVVLWQRRADALGLPPAYVTGYHIATDAEYRALPVAAYTALMARIARAEGRADRMVETLRDVVRPYIVARGTDPIFWGANVLSMIDDIISRAAEGA